MVDRGLLSQLRRFRRGNLTVSASVIIAAFKEAAGLLTQAGYGYLKGVACAYDQQQAVRLIAKAMTGKLLGRSMESELRRQGSPAGKLQKQLQKELNHKTYPQLKEVE